MRVFMALNGEPLSAQDLRTWAKWADLIVAVDGGLNHLVNCGILPHLHIGDMDSSKPVELETARTEIVQRQDRSDIEKALDRLKQMEVDQVWLGCAHGLRQDHFWNTFHAALQSGLRVGWVLPREAGYLVRENAPLLLGEFSGRTVSLMPLMESEVTLVGAKWPLERAQLELGKFVSLSNVLEGEQSACTVHRGAIALFLERKLGEVIPFSD